MQCGKVIAEAAVRGRPANWRLLSEVPSAQLLCPQVPKDIGVLTDWLGHQMALWRAGKLPATRQAQLRALGAEIAAPSAPAGARQA